MVLRSANDAPDQPSSSFPYSKGKGSDGIGRYSGFQFSRLGWPTIRELVYFPPSSSVKCCARNAPVLFILLFDLHFRPIEKRLRHFI